MIPINRDKPDRWKRDIARSVDMYNDWFMKFAPRAHQKARAQATKDVEIALKSTDYLRNVEALLRTQPSVLPSLRMSTSPPLAVERLSGLAGVSRNLINLMEKENRLPPRMSQREISKDIKSIREIVEKMADPDVFVWLGRRGKPTKQEMYRAATVVADRLCSAAANPIVRNAQERRQLIAIGDWLKPRGYKCCPPGKGTKYDKCDLGHTRSASTYP